MQRRHHQYDYLCIYLTFYVLLLLHLGVIFIQRLFITFYLIFICIPFLVGPIAIITIPRLVRLPTHASQFISF